MGSDEGQRWVEIAFAMLIHCLAAKTRLSATVRPMRHPYLVRDPPNRRTSPVLFPVHEPLSPQLLHGV